MSSILFAITTFVLVLVSDSLYIRAILRGTTKPSRSSFWIWSLVQVLTVASYAASGGGLAVALSAGYSVGFLLIAVLSLSRGEGHWRTLDTLCLFGAVASVAAWWLTRSSEIALILLLVTDGIGFIPTIAKSWRRPQFEDRLAWTLTSIASVTNLFAVQGWTSVDLAYGAYYVAMNGFVTALLWLRPRSVVS